MHQEYIITGKIVSNVPMPCAESHVLGMAIFDDLFQIFGSVLR